MGRRKKLDGQSREDKVMRKMDWGREWKLGKRDQGQGMGMELGKERGWGGTVRK